MEFDCLANQLHRFFPCFPDGHAARQIGYVRAEGRFAFLENHNVFHHGHLRLLEACLFQNTTECSSGDVDTFLTGNGHSTWFRSVTKLPVAAASANETPAIVFQNRNYFANSHVSQRYSAGPDVSMAALPGFAEAMDWPD
jgi:hypothetical protein